MTGIVIGFLVLAISYRRVSEGNDELAQALPSER